MLKRLLSFINHQKIINPAQYGARKQKSTELALVAQKEFILQNFEDQKIVLGLFLDLPKAFNLINHKILLEKLNHYGMRGMIIML